MEKKTLLRKIAGRLKMFFGYCPNCNSSAPELAYCPVCCLFDMPREYWWSRYRMLLRGELDYFEVGDEKLPKHYSQKDARMLHLTYLTIASQLRAAAAKNVTLHGSPNQPVEELLSKLYYDLLDKYVVMKADVYLFRKTNKLLRWQQERLMQKYEKEEYDKRKTSVAVLVRPESEEQATQNIQAAKPAK